MQRGHTARHAVAVVAGLALALAACGGSGEDGYWGIDDASVDALREIAPIVGIRVEDRPVDEPLARVAELAESLGGDTEDGDGSARADFEAASGRLSEALAAKPGLQVLAASGSEAELYVAYPPGFGDLAYYQGLGMDLVEPAEHPDGDGYWQALSWEEVDTYPADLILVDVRYAAIDELLAQAPAIVATLPAAEADQMVPWPAAYALGYGNVAAIIDELTASVEAASPDVV